MLLDSTKDRGRYGEREDMVWSVLKEAAISEYIFKRWSTLGECGVFMFMCVRFDVFMFVGVCVCVCARACLEREGKLAI